MPKCSACAKSSGPGMPAQTSFSFSGDKVTIKAQVSDPSSEYLCSKCLGRLPRPTRSKLSGHFIWSIACHD